MEKPNEDQVMPDGRITIGRKWIALRSGLFLLALLIGAIASAMYDMWVLSVVLIIFFGLFGLGLLFWVKSKP
jgi:hypothetical protein